MFESAVKSSYGAGRVLLRGAAMLRGSGSGGLEFFTPSAPGGSAPVVSQGALVPGFNKLHGATRMAVHMFVFDEGATRRVRFVGPHGMGEQGSTERLINGIAAKFG